MSRLRDFELRMLGTTRTRRALLVSVVLHAAVLYGLVRLRFELPEAGAIIQVSLIELGTADSTEIARAEARESTNAESTESPSVERIESDPRDEPPAAEALERVAEASAERRTESADATAPGEPEATDDGPAAAPDVEASPVDSTPPAEPSQAAAAVLATAPRVPDTDPDVSARSVPAPDPVADAPARPEPAPDRVADAPPRPEPRPVAAMPAGPESATVTLAEAELALLSERADRWARDAAELAAAGGRTSFRDGGRDYTASFTLVPARDGTGMDEVVVAVETDIDGQRYATELRLQRLAFSSFAQFVDRWDPAVRVHDDEIDGRFHSNSEILLDRSGGVQPRFLGKVTTARSVDTSTSERRIRRNEVFLGGLQTRVGRIALPRGFDLAVNAPDFEPHHLHRLTRSARITFLADGSYLWQYLEAMPEAERVELPDAHYYVVTDDEAELRVRGVVDGSVLVYSPERITIEDDLVYAVDPEIDATSDDYLGLVSDKRVEIAGPEVTGGGDLRVQASIYARTRFAVRDYRSRQSGTLHIFGSLTSGSLSATEPRYRTRLVFDRRLERLRPPGFPVSDRFETIALDTHWTAVGGYSDLPAGADSCDGAARGAANTCVQ